MIIRTKRSSERQERGCRSQEGLSEVTTLELGPGEGAVWVEGRAGARTLRQNEAGCLMISQQATGTAAEAVRDRVVGERVWWGDLGSLCML